MTEGADAHETPHEPERVLGAGDAVSVVVGAIIGIGIFFTPSSVAAIAGSGPLALAVWGLAGLIALAGALSFAELGGMVHGSGAQYEILKDAYGPLVAFLFVFCNATAVQAGAIALIATIGALNLSAAVRGAPFEGDRLLGLAALLILFVALVNALGVRFGGAVQKGTAIAKVLVLGALAAVAFLVGPGEGAGASQAATHALASPTSPALAVVSALVPAFFAYGGWQHALWISGEVKEPAKNVPRSLVVGVLVVVVVYVMANAAYLRLLGPAGVAGSHALAFDAVATVLPGAGRRVVAAAVAISSFGVLNAQLLSGPRLLFGMAKDGLFFPSVGALSGPAKAPVAAVLVIGGMALLLLLGGRHTHLVEQIIAGVVFVDGLFFALTGAAVVVLRRKRPDAPRPVRVPLYPLVPILFVLGEIGVVVGAYRAPETRAAAGIGAGWIVAATVLYFTRFRRPNAAEPGRL